MLFAGIGLHGEFNIAVKRIQLLQEFSQHLLPTLPDDKDRPHNGTNLSVL